jgi:hypothetical protein
MGDVRVLQSRVLIRQAQSRDSAKRSDESGGKGILKEICLDVERRDTRSLIAIGRGDAIHPEGVFYDIVNTIIAPQVAVLLELTCARMAQRE